MSKVKSETLKKEEKPVVAICYDFDKTLSPDDMQAQGFIQKLGYEIGEFWKKSNGFAKANNMDKNLAYMFTMKTESEGTVLFTKTELAKFGSVVELFPGVESWFERIRKYGEVPLPKATSLSVTTVFLPSYHHFFSFQNLLECVR